MFNIFYLGSPILALVLFWALFNCPNLHIAFGSLPDDLPEDIEDIDIEVD